MAKLNLLSTNSSQTRLLFIFTFFLAGALIPVVGTLFLFVLPPVMFILSLFNDYRKILFAFLLPLGIIFIVLAAMNLTWPALALSAMGLAGMAMTWAVRKNYSIETLVLTPFLIMTGAVAVYFISGALQLSISPWQLVEKHIRQAVELNVNLYSRLPLSADEIKSIQESKPSIIELITRIFPALCIMAILFTAWINMLISKIILTKYGVVPSQFVNLAEWKAPTWLVWIFLAAGGLMLIPQMQINFAGVNAFLSISFVYLLQGFAIVSFFFQKKDFSSFFRGLFYFFVAIQQILMIAIALLGFFDIWIDFRKYFRNDPATSE